MTEDLNKRNFRIAYYDKVGFKGIGEKALTAILNDDDIDRKRLENFCIRFHVPCTYRAIVWKILLNILPVHQQSHDFVMLQRTEQYNDLHHALITMRKIGDRTDMPEVYLKMHLLETGELRLKYHAADWHDTFCSVARAIDEIADAPIISYWISVKLYHFFEENNYLSHFDEFNNILTQLLKKDHNKLFNHLNELNFFNDPLIRSWYKCCFAGILQCSGCLERVWDILLGRAPRILVYVAVQILLVFERHLLQAVTLTKCREVLNKTPYSDEICDLVIHKAIEKWKKQEKIV